MTHRKTALRLALVAGLALLVSGCHAHGYGHGYGYHGGYHGGPPGHYKRGHGHRHGGYYRG